MPTQKVREALEAHRASLVAFDLLIHGATQAGSPQREALCHALYPIILECEEALAALDSEQGEPDRLTVLVEAARFYADEENYDEGGAPGNAVGSPGGDQWERDEGHIARAALKQAEVK